MAKKDKQDKVFTEIPEEETEKTPEGEEAAQEENGKEAELEKALEEAQKELAAAKEAHIRTLAEYDNFRKRTQKEKEAIFSESKVTILSELLPIIDNFDRAAQNSDADFESYKKGVEMMFSGFMDTMKKLGVEPFGEVGDRFDPNIHNAVMHIEDESLGENVITDVFSKGYKSGERVLRPAMVRVAN